MRPISAASKSSRLVPLHLAIDFREREIFEWLLGRGADINARASVDRDGFGGHTPLFNTVVNGPQCDATMARALLERGADQELRVSLRKFLDWRETPGRHVAPNVTALEWGCGFPEANWVNAEALRLLSRRDKP